MMKKYFAATAFFGLLFVFGLSCTSPFSPSTNLGQKVLNSIDSSITALTTGFNAIDSLNLAVVSARSIIVAGPDTSPFVLQSGDHRGEFLAGSFGGDSAFGYAEFHASSSILSSIRAACRSSADSIKLLLYYDSAGNDWQYGNSNTIQVFLCERKCFPLVRNDLTTAEKYEPCTTITFARTAAKDTFAISLGAGMISLLRSAAGDSTTRVKYAAKIDTVYGDSTFADTIVLPASVDSVILLRPAIYGDTAFFVTIAEHFRTLPLVTTFTWDTLVPVNRVKAVNATKNGDTAVIVYSTQHVVRFDTTFVHDSTEKFIGAVSVHASGGGIVRFGQPAFQVYYRAHCTDATPRSPVIYSPYYDICVTEKPALPADSLVASWQADRFVELKVNLQPFWDSISGVGTGKSYRIVQDASFLLSASDPVFEKVGTDTAKAIVYGLLDHQITDSKAHSFGTRDSLFGVIKAVAVNPSSLQISLPLAKFLQGMNEENPKPATGYLYLFVKPTGHFSRVIFGNHKTITCNALFSNPQR
jgi:hypothetical protein